MTNTKLLREKIDSKGLKLSFIAKAIGLKSRAGLMKKVNNETEFTAGEIKILCGLLGIVSWEETQAIFFAENVD